MRRRGNAPKSEANILVNIQPQAYEPMHPPPPPPSGTSPLLPPDQPPRQKVLTGWTPHHHLALYAQGYFPMADDVGRMAGGEPGSVSLRSLSELERPLLNTQSTMQERENNLENPSHLFS